MDTFINPNVAYVLLALGFLVAILAFFSPGTGLLELSALFCIVLAGYIMVNLPVNWWALLILALGFLPFGLAARTRLRRMRWIYLGGSILILMIGSAFLFGAPSGWPAIHPALILLMPACIGGLGWLLTGLGLEAIRRPHSFEPDHLVGMIGHAASDIHMEGSVYVNGENWSATSREFIPAGKKVRVCKRDGLTLEVELV